mgnify:CR=1 FL=1|tara:strand:- start:2166 stop:2981 length:816 start_codon:yes stop_codon:yes gene_type:complete
MSRNQSRTTGNVPEITNSPQPEAAASPFNFVVPTEMIDIPSKGLYYPPTHPLHNVDTIEIRHMTAKEEDILTSPTLLKKGIALDKMLQSIVVDTNIKIGDLLIGDKNALLIASRVYGYGPNYDVELACPMCKASFKTSFDLRELEIKEIDIPEIVNKTENNTFSIVLPQSNITIEFRLLTSRDELTMSSNKNSGTLALLKLITISVNGQVDKFYIERALQSLPIVDVSVLKKTYGTVMPDIDMTQLVECTECTETTEMGVPLDAGFFWPNI